jgi:hypothetical protein
MNPLIELKKTAPLLLITLALHCFALLPKAQAVLPPPDGGYPGGNTAEGQNALLTLTTGGFNTAVGFLSLRSNTIGSFNTALGAGTLLANTADNNTAVGAAALLSNTTGHENTANGTTALLFNTVGNFNTANGFDALLNNTTGSSNTASGDSALFQNTTGNFNTAIGVATLVRNIIGNDNTATGVDALAFNTTGGGNTAIGKEALENNTTGGNNTAIGARALFNSTTGNLNAALGFAAGNGLTTASNTICIGATGANVSNGCFIGNIFGVGISNDAVPVLIDSNDQLGTVGSSRRFKKEIKPMEKASEAVLALKPVTFRYKTAKRDTPQFGLIAEEVAMVNPDLVVRDKNGEIYTVRYDAVNAMLLNEFLKEHRRVQELEANATRQQKQIEALTAGLQKVSAQLATASPSDGGLEASKPAPQVVNNNY